MKYNRKAFAAAGGRVARAGCLAVFADDRSAQRADSPHDTAESQGRGNSRRDSKVLKEASSHMAGLKGVRNVFASARSINKLSSSTASRWTSTTKRP